MNRNTEPIHPGCYIKDYMSDCNERSINELAKNTGLDSVLIRQILEENSNAVITKDISKKLAEEFKISDGYFLKLQKMFDSNLKQQKKIPKMNQEKILLAALSAGQLDSSYSLIQVQYMMYVIDRGANKQLGVPFFNFRPSLYGPSDIAVNQKLDSLNEKNCVKITELTDEAEDSIHHYRLTEKGFTKGFAMLNSMPQYLTNYIKSTNEWVRHNEDRNSFASAMKEQYPEMTTNGVTAVEFIGRLKECNANNPNTPVVIKKRRIKGIMASDTYWPIFNVFNEFNIQAAMDQNCPNTNVSCLLKTVEKWTCKDKEEPVISFLKPEGMFKIKRLLPVSGLRFEILVEHVLNENEDFGPEDRNIFRCESQVSLTSK